MSDHSRRSLLSVENKTNRGEFDCSLMMFVHLRYNIIYDVCVCVVLSSKEKKKLKKKSKKVRKQQVPAEMADEPDLAKYWAQRYRLFSRFDDGIKLDRGQSVLCIHAL